VTLPTIQRGGRYLRVADPTWKDPLDGAHSRERGGRWNPPQTFPVVYLNKTVRAARANVARLFAGMPYGPEDLLPEAAPVLMGTDVPHAKYLDVITDAGCMKLGLAPTYPLDDTGHPIGHERCQSIGERAWHAGLPGVACHSAAPNTTTTDEELAWFQRDRRLTASERLPFETWFWTL
jgi:RES domain-containing protein